MNQPRDLHARLLHLFPIRVVKEQFDKAGRASDVIEEILDNYLGKQIRSFACEQTSYTKQNIFLFKANKDFKREYIKDSFPWPIVCEKIDGTKGELVFLIKVEFSVFVDNPPQKEELHFFQPVAILFDRKKVSIHLTKLKKNVQAYFEDNRNAKLIKIKNDERTVLNKFLEHIEESLTITSLDINAGIKELWEKDEIDCRKLKWRDHHSLEMTVMDEDSTFKETYPERYVDVAVAPLGSSVFSYLKDDDDFCRIFGTNPSEGHLNISKFPKTSEQVSNVIAKILENN